MDIRQLRYFLAVSDQRSFTRAAEYLDISQPTLNRAITGFERELGVTLFHRVERTVELTPAGTQLLVPARRVVRGMDAARSSIDALKGLGRSLVEITTMASPGVEPLTTLLRSFTAHYPDVEVTLGSAIDPEDVLQTVRTGAGEIGLLGAITPITVADLVVIPVEEQGLVLITTAAGDLAGRDGITAQDLAGRRLVTAQRGSLIHRFVTDIAASGVDISIPLDVQHRRSTILPIVLSGAADAVLPDGWAGLARSAGADVLRLEPTSQLHVALVHRRDPLTPAAAAFVATVRAYTDHTILMIPDDPNQPPTPSATSPPPTAERN
jgi:DNA-binding transcriptional LysR family regulator